MKIDIDMIEKNNRYHECRLFIFINEADSDPAMKMQVAFAKRDLIWLRAQTAIIGDH